MRKLYMFILAAAVAAAAGLLKPVRALGAQQAYRLETSNDGRMWTVHQTLPTEVKEDGTPVCWYGLGTRCLMGRASELRVPEAGEHYYKYDRTGKVPVGEWRVADPYVFCISRQTETMAPGHGIISGNPDICELPYFSGWMAYCADCGDAILRGNVYMSYEAAKSIDVLDVDMGYYFLCPCMRPVYEQTESGREIVGYEPCGHLNRYWEARPHKCKGISRNRYRVVYDANARGAKGTMAASFHMYDNADTYEGKKVTPSRTLSLCTFDRTAEGYVFAGWNTKPDGRGDFYEDGAEILNLSAENYKEGTDLGTVTLYAQWKRVQSTLKIDANGGSYQGENPIVRNWGSYWSADSSLLIPPSGYTARFQADGGTLEMPQITGTRSFWGWRLAEPAAGEFHAGSYRFTGGSGSVDTLQAVYAPDPIILPTPSKSNHSFAGWYLDSECTQLAGYGGDPYILTGNVIMYAKWVDLKLTAVPDYAANKGKGAVNLSWAQQDGVGKTYLIYRRGEGQRDFEQIYFSENEGLDTLPDLSYEYEGQPRKLVIPSTGFYTLTAEGAQGGNYGAYAGGPGGRAEGIFYLEKGETVSFTVGGQNGFNGGGSATDFGSGGGYTVVSSDKKGILLIAGGGGGATSSCGGLQGGDITDYVPDKGSSGGSGMAGGGGGALGGRAGTRIVHVHSVENGCYRDGSIDALASDYTVAPALKGWWDEETDWEDDSFIRRDYYFSSQMGSSDSLIPVDGNRVLDLGVWIYGEGINEIGGKTYIQVADQNGVPFFTSTIARLRQEWNGFETGVVLPAGSGIYNGWPPIANISMYTDWSKSDPDSDDYDILDGYQISYPIFYEDGTARAAKVALDSEYRNPVFYGNYAGEYYPPADIWNSDIASRRGFAGRPILFSERSKWYGMSGAYFRHKVDIPEGTTGLYIYAEGMMDSLENHLGEKIPKPIKWCTIRFDKVYLSGGMILDCDAMDIDVPAEGGSSFVNLNYAMSSSTAGGVRNGNGRASIRAEMTGFTEAGNMHAVDAPDKAAPYAVEAGTVTMSAAGDHTALIEFAGVEDRGTRYSFKAESYSFLTGEKICDSNIAECLVTTGLKGYCYLIDPYGGTEISALDVPEKMCKMLQPGDRKVEAEISEKTRYLHIAAVDNAGNISDTVHVKLEAKDISVIWDISTENMEISSIVGENDYGSVYPAGQENTYYVKADGNTPFLLSFRSYIQGPARADYQIDHQIYDMRTEGQVQKYGILLPCSETMLYDEVLDASQFRQWTEGASILTDASYMGAVRSRGTGAVSCSRGFIMPASQSGSTVSAVPVAGATYKGSVKYSDWDDDIKHAVRLIGDGEGPVITGLEKLSSLELIDRKNDSVLLEICARDDLSGIRDFYLEIKNKDNFLEERFYPDEDGVIRINITEAEPIFSGAFTVLVYTKDNVGNETVTDTEVTEFALTADVSRILSPHDPIFKQGESGILSVEVWGYAEKVEVEFPDFLSGYNRTFLYTASPQHRKTEEIQFMIPLDAPEAVCEITVRAYKGDKKLEAHPAISTLEVDGSVLDELRTRLR